MLALIAISMPVLLGMAGFAVDMGRLFAAQTRLQAAVDAAALAGSLHLATDPSLESGQAANAATEYLRENYREAYLTDLGPGPEARSVCLTARADVPMTFMAVLAIKSRPVYATACAGMDDVEVVMVIDNSGSLEGEPIQAVKRAANRLVDLLIPEGETSSVKIGLVPFRGKVRVDENVDGQPAGCRNADGSINTSQVSVPDESCANGALPPIHALTNSKSDIKQAINDMSAMRGYDHASGTLISEGIKWGRHVLSPESPYVEGRTAAEIRKVMILLTDGGNEDGTCGDTANNPRTKADSAYRRNAFFQMKPAVTDCGCEDHGCLDQRMLNESAKAKEGDSIEVFTVRFGDSSGVDIELMKAMASSREGGNDHYFDAPSMQDLDRVFEGIARRLAFRLL